MCTRQVKWFLFLCSIIIVPVGFLTGQFILERKEKKASRVSSSVLREQCVKKMGNVMQTIPIIMHGLADTQTATLAQVDPFLNGEECFLHSAKKDQLIYFDQKLTVYGQQLTAISKTLEELALFFQSLNSTKLTKNKPVKNKKLVKI